MAAAKGPNLIWKDQSKQNLATYFSRQLASKHCLLISPHIGRGLPFQTREKGEITWYMEWWDNGKRVTTRMPRGSMKEESIPGRKALLPSHPSRKHTSHPYPEVDKISPHSHLVPWWAVVNLSSHVLIYLQTVLFSSAFRLTCSRHFSRRPSQLIHLDWITLLEIICKRLKLQGSYLCRYICFVIMCSFISKSI
jgi:hypothetical protein